MLERNRGLLCLAVGHKQCSAELELWGYYGLREGTTHSHVIVYSHHTMEWMPRTWTGIWSGQAHTSYHWKSFMRLFLKGNICLPTKAYNLKNIIWSNYILWIKTSQKWKQRLCPWKKITCTFSCNKRITNIPPLHLFRCHLFFFSYSAIFNIGNVYNMATSAKWKDVLSVAGGNKTDKRLLYL